MGSKRKVDQQMDAKARSNRGPVGKGRSRTLPARDVRFVIEDEVSDFGEEEFARLAEH